MLFRSKAGLLKGDAIVSYNGVKIKTPGDLSEQVGNTAVGSRVEIELYRDGSLKVLEAYIEAKK